MRGKAFDTVDHVILVRKLFCLATPVFIMQWIMSFLIDRNQATKLGFHLSSTLPINRSVIQGSGIGPTLMYADDATLFISQKSKTSVELEMAHVMK